MNLKTAQSAVRAYGLMLVKRDGEYIVKEPDVPVDHGSTYFTDDLEDDVSTARIQAEQLRAHGVIL
jgi:hypothetical protein